MLVLEYIPFDGSNKSTEYWLQSFTTPDKKTHQITYYYHGPDDIVPPDYESIRCNKCTVFENINKCLFTDDIQPKDPLDDERQADALRIVIHNNLKEYEYVFTWNGDKLIEGKNFNCFSNEKAIP